MNGHKIFPSPFIKYIGVYLDTNLNGKFHCDLLMPKLKRANGMLCKARHYIPIEELNPPPAKGFLLWHIRQGGGHFDPPPKILFL